MTEPEPNVQRVVQRGRRRRTIQTGAVAAGTLSLAVVTVLGMQGLNRSRVEFAPAAAPPASLTPSAEPSPIRTEAAQPSPSASPEEWEAPPVDTIDVKRLGETVLAFEPGHGLVMAIDSSGDDVTWPEPVTAVFPDGRSGFVVQTVSQEIVWVPLEGPEVALRNAADPDHPDATEVTLRGVDPDGSVIFSARPKKRYDEGIVERFFTVPLDGAGKPTLIAEEGAYESGYVGPAAVSEGSVAQRYVIASCHLLCSLWRWPEAQGPNKPVYDGHTAIEGLTSNPNRTLVAFVESNIAQAESATVDLVVLDASTFDERLRLSLPVLEGTPIGGAVVSLSSDGQRILVSVDAPAKTKVPVPRTTFLVDDAVTSDPIVRKVNYFGVVRWLDPGTVQKK